MRVLAVVGSPRKRGNTDLLVDAFLEGAREAGAVVEKVYLTDLKIRGCDACDVCRTSGECVIDDDMGPLYGKLLDSDVWLLGTPVYWWGPSSQTKAFIDRWYAFSDDERRRLKGKRAVLLSPFEDSDPGTPRHLVGMLAEAFNYLNMQFVGQVLVTAGALGEVARNQAALEEARTLGRKIAST